MNSQSGGSKDGRIPQLTELFGDEIYKTATLDDLLQVELKKRIWGDEGQKLDQYLAQKPARTTGQAQKGDKSGIFGKMGVANALTRMGTYPVSYTHLDGYKRQERHCCFLWQRRRGGSPARSCPGSGRTGKRKQPALRRPDFWPAF